MITLAELLVAFLGATAACLIGERFAAWGQRRYGWDLSEPAARLVARVRGLLARIRQRK